MSSYLEQYKRVKRWHARFAAINNGLEHTKSSDYYADEVYAFFQNCYHLKDWIKNDPLSGQPGPKVEGFVHSSLSLRICGI
jgi:hypothetical protein